MMTVNTDMDLAGLEALLAAFGADRQRWPSARQAAAAQLLAASAEARARLAEAEALDRVLATAAPVALAVSGGLVDRIMAEAMGRTTAGVSPSVRDRAAVSNVIPLARPEPRPPAPVRAAVPRADSRIGQSWRAAAVLALALMTGVAIGSLDILAGPLAGLGEIVGIETDAETTTVALQFDSLPSLVDEEQL